MFYKCKKVEKHYDFENAIKMFENIRLGEICLSTLPANKHIVKYVYFNKGYVHTIISASGEIKLYGNFLDLDQNHEIIKEFNNDKKFLESIGIAGACISLDSLISFHINVFDKNELGKIDTLKLYNNYSYLYLSNKKKFLSDFVLREYNSPLFRYKNYFFYYSKY